MKEQYTIDALNKQVMKDNIYLSLIREVVGLPKDAPMAELIAVLVKLNAAAKKWGV